jgi:hypothetical protein
MHLKPNADEKTEKRFNQCCLMVIETVMTGFDVGIFPVRNGKFSLSEKERGCIDVSTSLAPTFHVFTHAQSWPRDTIHGTNLMLFWIHCKTISLPLRHASINEGMHTCAIGRNSRVMYVFRHTELSFQFI